jgi:AbrB family looped-hinge helix DNA binding protein
MTTISVSMDSKGRLSIPKSLRDQLHLEPGDVFILDPDENQPGFHVVKARPPFETIAEFAKWAVENGHTRSLREVAEEYGVKLDAESSFPS